MSKQRNLFKQPKRNFIKRIGDAVLNAVLYRHRTGLVSFMHAPFDVNREADGVLLIRVFSGRDSEIPNQHSLMKVPFWCENYRMVYRGDRRVINAVWSAALLEGLNPVYIEVEDSILTPFDGIDRITAEEMLSI